MQDCRTTRGFYNWDQTTTPRIPDDKGWLMTIHQRTNLSQGIPNISPITSHRDRKWLVWANISQPLSQLLLITSPASFISRCSHLLLAQTSWGIWYYDACSKFSDVFLHINRKREVCVKIGTPTPIGLSPCSLWNSYKHTLFIGPFSGTPKLNNI